jgi:hypothetical protein
MSSRAMELINRDESRHIAIDYHMTEFYASPGYQASLVAQPKRSVSDTLRAWRAFAGVLVAAGPFFEKVFFSPMARLDPSGKRLREAVKRMQIIGARQNVAARPFYRFMSSLRTVNTHKVFGPVLGKVARRLSGNFPAPLTVQLFDDEDLARANRVPIDDLAEDALHAKLVD